MGLHRLSCYGLSFSVDTIVLCAPGLYIYTTMSVGVWKHYEAEYKVLYIRALPLHGQSHIT